LHEDVATKVLSMQTLEHLQGMTYFIQHKLAEFPLCQASSQWETKAITSQLSSPEHPTVGKFQDIGSTKDNGNAYSSLDICPVTDPTLPPRKITGSPNICPLWFAVASLVPLSQLQDSSAYWKASL